MKGSIRQRSKGTWQLRYDAPPDGTRRRRFVSKTFKGNKKDAERALRELLATIENGGYVASDKETVAQFMVRWLETYAATNTNRKTQQGYRGLIDRYLTPYLGNIKLQNLTARRIQALYADMHSRGLGAPSIVATHRVLKEALGHAVKWSVITRNVADAATPPRIERKTMPMWDVAEINRFLDATANDHFYPVYHLAILTGLRRSEIFGLKWDAIDLAGSTLQVVRTLQRITDYGLVEGQPKTQRSRRSISLPPAAVELLHGVRVLKWNTSCPMANSGATRAMCSHRWTVLPLILTVSAKSSPSSLGFMGCRISPSMDSAMHMRRWPCLLA
jgi:integrase